MLMKVVVREGRKVVFVVDEELLGKTFREGRAVLRVTEFYRGEEVEEGDVEREVREADMVTAIGERSVGVVIRVYGGREKVKRVEGVPYINVYKI